MRALGTMITTAVAALVTIPGSARADTYDHMDMLALKLQKQTQALHREVDLHFKNTRSYRHLHEDIEQMEHLAAHIHELAHRHGSVAHLKADVDKLDRTFHHLEDVVRGLSRDRRIDFQTIRHIRQEMAGINDTLHHLQDDLRRLTPAPALRPHGHGSHIDAPRWRIELSPRGIRVAPPTRPHGHDHDHHR